MRVLAVILAAGSGDRFGAAVPKQFSRIDGVPLVTHVVRAVQGAGVDCVVAMPPSWHEHGRAEVGGCDVIAGGPTRTETVRCAWREAQRRGADALLLHAATRPFLTSALVSYLVDHADGYDGLMTGCRLVGGLVDHVSGDVAQRDRFIETATPELVRVQALAAGLARATRDHTLAAEFVLAAGLRVGYVEPGFLNLKVTYPGDLGLAERLWRAGVVTGEPAGPFPIPLPRSEGDTGRA